MPPNHRKSDEREEHRCAEQDEVYRGAGGKHDGSGGTRKDCPEATKRHSPGRSPCTDGSGIYMGAQGEHGGLNRVDEEAMRGDSREQQEGVLVKTKLADEERGDRGRGTAGDQRPSRPEAGDGPRAEQGAENAAGIIDSKRERGIVGPQSRGNEKRWQPAEGGVGPK